MASSYPTIKDLANRLGLSPSTISRALHDHPAISQKTKARVKALAQELEYYPDSIARSLQMKGTKTVGVIVPEIRHHFFSSAIDGIEDVAYKEGYTIIVSKSNEKHDREVVNTRSMVSNRVAGLIVSVAQTTSNSRHFQRVKERGIPLVFFDRILEDVDVSKVVVDDYAGALSAVEHLIDSGYRRIAHLAGPRHLYISRERLRGYLDALAGYGLAVDEALIIHGGLHEEDGEAGFKELKKLPNAPDAVFAVNDPVAIGAFRVIKANNLRIPDDVGLVGFSNNPITEIIEPPLSTVDQPGYEMGQTAARLLLEAIDGQGSVSKPVTRILKTHLIIRGSSRKTRIADQ
ncbi:MAG: LacI family DNA-binding transcriptional regulator [Candidatus Neomarinimicrobiota bacterium]